MYKIPFVVVLELSWNKSYRVGPSPGQLWSQHLKPTLGNLDNLREHKTIYLRNKESLAVKI